MRNEVIKKHTSQKEKTRRTEQRDNRSTCTGGGINREKWVKRASNYGEQDFDRPDASKILTVTKSVFPVRLFCSSRVASCSFMTGLDLKTLLQRSEQALGVQGPAIPLGCHYSMLADIAAGMEFLASHHVTHKRLQTRCCLVDADFSVKISEYCRIDLTACKLLVVLTSRILFYFFFFPEPTFVSCWSGPKELWREVIFDWPVRWLAPETITNMNFNVNTDVYAYGILAWEVFSNGKLP